MCEPFFLLVIFSAKFAIEVSRVAGGTRHGLNNNIDTKAKCRHLKNWPAKGHCSRSLSGFIDWRFSQSKCWYFRPSFLNCCPFNLLSGPTPFPPSLSSFPVSKYSIYRECVAGRELVVLSPVGDHILQEFNTLYLTRFRSYKNATVYHPKQKPGGGGGATNR